MQMIMTNRMISMGVNADARGRGKNGRNLAAARIGKAWRNELFLF